jgi:uncharacterized membrane protein YhaH (DUF805 family)
MNWYIQVWKKYAIFGGRARRKEYWFFALFNIIAVFILAFIDALLGTFSQETGVGLLSGVYSLAVLIPSIAVAVRRLHDTDRVGWWVLIGLIPLIGAIVLIIFFVLDSTPGDNRFGLNPKGATA